jgi:hypothetical protein
VENVVATIEAPVSHRDADPPDVRNSAVLKPDRRARIRAGMKGMIVRAATMNQSRFVSCIVGWRRPTAVSTGQISLQPAQT